MTRGETDMVKRFNRIWSIAISLSLLASVPAFGDIPIVPPISGGSDNGISGPETAGPGGDNTQSGPGASTGTGNSTGTGTSAGTGNSTGPGTSAGPGATQGSGTGGSVVNTLKQPEIQAQGAVLMDAATGNLLYSKEAETKFYPASITKLMTALLVAEKCSLDDTVTFSKTAVTNLESGAVTLGLVEGDKLTVRQSLYGLLLKSANEVANGLAEHTAGSISKFADMMNARAKELGCTNTNFVNPNGLNNSNHYTTPHDMALIARAAFQNGTVSKIASTLSYQIPATQKAAARTISLGHKMLYPNDARYYQGVIGGKTGYFTGRQHAGDMCGAGRRASDRGYHEEQVYTVYGYLGSAGLRFCAEERRLPDCKVAAGGGKVVLCKERRKPRRQ